MLAIGTMVTALVACGFSEIRFGVARDGSDARKLEIYKLNQAPPTELFAVPNARGTGFSHIIGQFSSTLSHKSARTKTSPEQHRVDFANVNPGLFAMKEKVNAGCGRADGCSG
jgi:hypothetical protein